jgi:aminopeptidase
MTDPRILKLADLLVNYACGVKPGESLLLEAIDVPHAFTKAVIAAVSKAGGRPVAMLKSNEINRALMFAGSQEQWDLIADIERAQMERVQCYIGARGNPNVSETSDVPADKQKLYESTVWSRVHHDIRIKKTRWCVLPSIPGSEKSGAASPMFSSFMSGGPS